MFDLTLRNLELFFRDKVSVLMSLLAEVIIMVLYILFMRDNLLDMFKMPGDIDMLIDTWMIAGIVGITPLTASTGAYGIMVTDKADKRIKDFYVSPLRDTSFVTGYFMCAVIVSVILSLAVLFMSEIYVYLRYGYMAGIGNVLKIYIVIIIDSLCCAAMMILPAVFLKTVNALAGCCTIMGALVGFVTGIYLPLGSLDGKVDLIVKVFPVSHGVTVLRQLLVEPVMNEKISVDEKTAADFMEYMGIYFRWGEESVSGTVSVMIMLISTAVFLLSVFLIRRCMRIG